MHKRFNLIRQQASFLNGFGRPVHCLGPFIKEPYVTVEKSEELRQASIQKGIGPYLERVDACL